MVDVCSPKSGEEEGEECLLVDEANELMQKRNI